MGKLIMNLAEVQSASDFNSHGSGLPEAFAAETLPWQLFVVASASMSGRGSAA